MNGPVIIGIAGGTASGKTTIAKQLKQILGKKTFIMSMDRFYKSLPIGTDPQKYNFDVPDAFDFNLFYETLLNMCKFTSNVTNEFELAKSEQIKLPIYDFVSHTTSEELVPYTDISTIIVEGILTFHDPNIRELFDFKIFIEADSDIRLSRRIIRDSLERGRTVQSVIDQYLSTVKPSHEGYIQPTKQFSDIHINTNMDNNEQYIDKIIKHLNQNN